MPRTTIKTSTGFRVYGEMSCVMDLNESGTVTYSNVVADCKEYRMMLKAFKAFKAA